MFALKIHLNRFGYSVKVRSPFYSGAFGYWKLVMTVYSPNPSATPSPTGEEGDKAAAHLAFAESKADPYDEAWGFDR